MLSRLIMEESEDLAWWTEREEEQALQELHYLKQFDQQTKEYRDIRWMYFRREVLDKYRDNELCEIGSEHISFLPHDKKKTSASTVNFVNRNFANIDGIVLMLQAQQYINVPPTERPHETIRNTRKPNTILDKSDLV
jgi:hypothetical protein